jgi:hypothetical protein
MTITRNKFWPALFSGLEIARAQELGLTEVRTHGCHRTTDMRQHHLLNTVYGRATRARVSTNRAIP